MKEIGSDYMKHDS